MAVIFSIVFIFVEIFVAPEPVLAPFLLRRKIPVLVGISNFLVAICNFSIMYFFPMWFQTVAMTKASIAGKPIKTSPLLSLIRWVGMHLMPNSISMSVGSVFAGWVVHATGKYKTLNLILGACPFIGAVLIYYIREDSGPIQSWLSIVSPVSALFLFPLTVPPRSPWGSGMRSFFRRCSVSIFFEFPNDFHPLIF